MEEEKQNKKREPSSNKAGKMVTIRINHNRVIAGLGQAGDEFEVSELVAQNFVAQGLATIIKKEN